MEKNLNKLEVKDVATIEIINQTETPSHVEFEHTKQKLSSLKNDASETAQCLDSINTKIKDHLERMAKLRKLDLTTI